MKVEGSNFKMTWRRLFYDFYSESYNSPKINNVPTKCPEASWMPVYIYVSKISNFKIIKNK